MHNEKKERQEKESKEKEEEKEVVKEDEKEEEKEKKETLATVLGVLMLGSMPSDEIEVSRAAAAAPRPSAHRRADGGIIRLFLG